MSARMRPSRSLAVVSGAIGAEPSRTAELHKLALMAAPGRSRSSQENWFRNFARSGDRTVRGLSDLASSLFMTNAPPSPQFHLIGLFCRPTVGVRVSAIETWAAPNRSRLHPDGRRPHQENGRDSPLASLPPPS